MTHCSYRVGGTSDDPHDRECGHRATGMVETIRTVIPVCERHARKVRGYLADARMDIEGARLVPLVLGGECE